MHGSFEEEDNYSLDDIAGSKVIPLLENEDKDVSEEVEKLEKVTVVPAVSVNIL